MSLRNPCLFILFRSESVASIRNCSVNTELIRREYNFEQQFRVRHLSVEMYEGLIFHLFQNSTTASTDTREDGVIVSMKIRINFAAAAFHLVSGR